MKDFDIKSLTDQEVISLYPKTLQELKNRKIIRTNNLVGDLGEYWCIKKYNETAGLPKLQDAPESTKNIDAISVKGERYAIKSTSGSGTSTFASIPINDDTKPLFEYVVLVLFDKDYVLKL